MKKYEKVLIVISAIFVCIIISAVILYPTIKKIERKKFNQSLNNKLNSCLGTTYNEPLKIMYDKITIGMKRSEVESVVKCYDDFDFNPTYRYLIYFFYAEYNNARMPYIIHIYFDEKGEVKSKSIMIDSDMANDI